MLGNLLHEKRERPACEHWKFHIQKKAGRGSHQLSIVHNEACSVEFNIWQRRADLAVALTPLESDLRTMFAKGHKAQHGFALLRSLLSVKWCRVKGRQARYKPMESLLSVFLSMGKASNRMFACTIGGLEVSLCLSKQHFWLLATFMVWISCASPIH